MSMRDGQFQIDFEAEKQKDPGGAGLLLVQQLLATGHASAALTSYPSTPSDDPVTGTWEGTVSSDQLPNGEIGFTLELKMDDDNLVTGKLSFDRGELEVSEGDYKASTKKLYLYCENDQFFLDLEAVIDGRQMKGDVSVNDSINAELAAQRSGSKATTSQPATNESDRQDADDQEAQPTQNRPRQGRGQNRAFLGVSLADGLTIQLTGDDSPAGKAGMKSGDTIVSIAGQRVSTPTELLTQLRGKRPGETIEVVVKRGDQEQSIKVELGTAPANPGVRRPRNQNNRRPPIDDESESTESESQQEAVAADDPISGTWTGTLNSPQGESDLTIILKRKSNREITGTYETTRSDGELSEGSYDPKTKTLTLAVDNDQFSLEFSGVVNDDKFAGDIDFNGGAFSMDFAVKRIEKSGRRPNGSQ